MAGSHSRRHIEDVETILLTGAIVQLRSAGYDPVDLATALLLRGVAELRRKNMSPLFIAETLIAIADVVIDNAAPGDLDD